MTKETSNVLILDPKRAKEAEANGNMPHVENKDDEEENRGAARLIFSIMLFILVIGLLNDNYNSRKRSESRERTLSAYWNRMKNKDSEMIRQAQLYTPEQLHLSLGVDDSELYLTWSTMAYTYCRLSYGKINRYKELASEKWVPAIATTTHTVEDDKKWSRVSGEQHRRIITYRAKLTNLERDRLYIYRAMCSDPIPGKNKEYKYVSAVYRYKVRDFSNSRKPFNLALYGDLGLDNSKSVPNLIEDVDNNIYDLIIHNGDFAYDLNTQNGAVGDRFMRMIEPIAARIPYQTSVGNHELAQNFTHYNSRFSMINQGSFNKGKQNNFYYSFNVGPVHFISFSTEFYYYVEYSGREALQLQYEWLEKDLAQASSPSERAVRPWIVVFGHRPMYCSSNDNDDCTKDSNILRRGLSGIPGHTYALEKLFFDHGVDVQFYSHEHQYERFLPLYDGKIMNGTENSDPYYNPRGPVHIISGSAGCNERIDDFTKTPKTGSVKRVSDYGYTQLAVSRCKLAFRQVSVDQADPVVDEFSITKSKLSNFPKVSDEELDCNMVYDELLMRECDDGLMRSKCSNNDLLDRIVGLLPK